MVKLRDYQLQTIENVFDGYNRGINSGIIRCFTGGGKCHGINTPILMYDGTIRMVQDVKVGDLLMGPDSKPRKVLSLARGREEMYEVIPTKGDSWTCNKSHILSLVCNKNGSWNNKRFYPSPAYNQIIDISVEDYLTTPKGFKHVHKLFRTGVEFPSQDVGIDPWLLGIWLGDGTSSAPSITNPNPDVIKNIDIIATENNWISHDVSSSDKCATWYIKGGFLQVLRDHNLLANKHIPDNFLYNTRKIRLELLAGLLDSDGYLGHNGYEITTKSDILAEQILFLARSLGLAAYKKLKKATIKHLGFVGYYHRINISGHTDIIPCRVGYKQASPRQQIKDVLRTGFKLKPLGVGNYYGFVIDGDHRYLLGDFTVTHNTEVAVNLAQRWRDMNKGKVLFLVDQILLAYQARDRFKKYFPNLKIGLEMNEHHADGDEHIIISCVPSIGRKGSKRIGKFEVEDFTLCICDEVHKALAPSWLRVLHYLGFHPENFTDGKLLVGITATPRRKGGGLGFLFHDFFANYPIEYGMREGWLVTPEWIKIKTNIDISSVKKKGDEYSPKELEELAELLAVEQRNNLVIKAYKDEGCPSSIIYCLTVDHAYQLKQLFETAGIRAEVIEANTDKDDRKEWTQEFRSGELNILLNHSTLTTGADFPDLEAIFLTRPIGSDVLYEQIIGRVLRPHSFSFIDAMPDKEARKKAISASTKPYAKVIDLVDTCASSRLQSPLTLLGINDKMKTEDRVKVYEQVYEPLEKVKHEHGIDISEITDIGEIDAIVVRSKGITHSHRVPENLADLTNMKWLKAGDDEYELILQKAKKTLFVTCNLVDKWELHEYDLTSKTGAGKLMNTFNTLAGALRVADEYVGGKYKEDARFVSRSWAQQNKPPSEKQLGFIHKLFARACYWDKEHYDLPNGGKTTYNRLWIRRPGGDELVDTMEVAGNIITTRLNK